MSHRISMMNHRQSTLRPSKYEGVRDPIHYIQATFPL